ncbi:hypothetical protein GCM10010182_04120 [Actinomadura cremea]|nr:hypothetical protein GCM10010182_04120 [Actinomadura cremea]
MGDTHPQRDRIGLTSCLWVRWHQLLCLVCLSLFRGGRSTRRGGIGPERPHARRAGAGGRLATRSGALEDVEKVLIRLTGLVRPLWSRG